MKILVFDPGNSTGWVYHDTEDHITLGGTIFEDFIELKNLIDTSCVNMIVYETFALYPGVAKSLSWNTFYPCEVIGVIKLCASLCNVQCINQSPSIKKYAGKVDFKQIQGEQVTGHTKDAYLHLAYFLRTHK